MDKGQQSQMQGATPDRTESIYQDLSLFRVPKGFRGRSGLVVLMWQIVSQTIFSWSPQPAYLWRSWLLKLFGAKVGKDVRIRPTARITYPWKVSFGNHCWIGDDAEIYSLGNITIGNHAIVSQRSYICSATHEYTELAFPYIVREVIIEDEAWVATDSFIAPGVVIGKGAIVGARSTVLTSVPEGVIVAGSPAKVIGHRPLSQISRGETGGDFVPQPKSSMGDAASAQKRNK